MDGVNVAKAARVGPTDLAPDPSYPFLVVPSPRLSPPRRNGVKAAMLGAGWGQLGADERAPLLRVLLGRLDATSWDAFLEAALTAAVAAEPDDAKRWRADPWRLWRTVLDDEQDRRDAAERARIAAIPPVQGSMDAEMARRQTECARLLGLLRAAGPAGVLNSDLEATEVGRRYSARIFELREQGYAIDTVREGARAFRFVLTKEVA